MSETNTPAAELGITAEDMGVEPITTQGIEKLFGQSFEIKKLENGKLIPAGGTNLFTDELDRAVVGDFDHLRPCFRK